MSDKIQVTSANAPKFIDWLRNRNGIAVWTNQAFDSGDFGHEVFQPVLDAQGQPYRGAQLSIPWKYGGEPTRIITNIDEIEVSDPVLVETCHERRGIEKKLGKHGAEAWYEYDKHATIHIFVPGPAVSLREWAAQHE